MGSVVCADAEAKVQEQHYVIVILSHRNNISVYEQHYIVLILLL